MPLAAADVPDGEDDPGARGRRESLQDRISLERFDEPELPVVGAVRNDVDAPRPDPLGFDKPSCESTDADHRVSARVNPPHLGSSESRARIVLTTVSDRDPRGRIGPREKPRDLRSPPARREQNVWPVCADVTLGFHEPVKTFERSPGDRSQSLDRERLLSVERGNFLLRAVVLSSDDRDPPTALPR